MSSFNNNVFSPLNHPFLHAARPQHWVKNVFVLAPLFFSGRLTDYPALTQTVAYFLAFCLVASSVYLMNDILDRDKDRLHPLKKHRPIASGEISVRQALWGIAALSFPAFLIAFLVGFRAGLVLLGYFALNLVYSYLLKNIVLLDVTAIASGFVLRVLGGACAAQVDASPWLISATFLLALFIALIKRRQELLIAGPAAKQQRNVLSDYTLGMINLLLAFITPVTFIVFLAYSLNPDTVNRLSAPHLYMTSGLVLFGLIRYMVLAFRDDLGETPVSLLYSDKLLILTIVLWAGMFAWIVYN